LLAASEAYADLAYYMGLLDSYGGTTWVPGNSFSDEQEIPLAGATAIIEPTNNGAILYSISSQVPVFVPVDVLAEGEEGVSNLVRVALEADEAELAEVGADVALAPAF